jgi:hypothetical protein
VLGYLHQHGVKALFEIGLREDLEGAAIQFGSIDWGGQGVIVKCWVRRAGASWLITVKQLVVAVLLHRQMERQK